MLICLFFLFNINLINISTETTAEDPPKQVFGPGIQYKVGDWYLVGEETYTNSIIDLRGNLSIERNAKLILKNSTLRINITSLNQDYRIYVKPGGQIHILNDSLITDSPFDADTGIGQTPEDFRYRINVDHGTIIIKNSTIEEVGPYLIYDVFKVQGRQSKFIMEYSTLNRSFDGIRLYGLSNAVIKYCDFINSRHLAVYCNNVNNSVFKNNYIYNVTYYGGYGFHMNYGTNNHIVNNTLETVGSYGIYCYYESKQYILNNSIINCGSRGMYIRYGSDIYILNCSLNKISSDGIRIDYTANVFIENNSIYQAYYGLYVYHGNWNRYQIRNNTLDYITSYYGYYIRYLKYSTIYDNKVNNSLYGMYIYGGEYLEVSNNIVTNASYYGLLVGYIYKTSVHNNYINSSKSTWYYGLYVYSWYSDSGVSVENNTIWGAQNGMIIDSLRDAVISNNLIYGPGSNNYMGMQIYYTGNLRFENNIVHNYQYGLYGYSISYYGPIIFYGGRFSSNSYLSIYLEADYEPCDLILYNTSFDQSKIDFYSWYEEPSVKAYYYVDVFVKDTKGGLGGAKVTIKEKTSTLPDVVKYTDKSGHIPRVALLGFYKTPSTTTSYTYNFSSEVSGEKAYAPVEYTINSYKKITINYGQDTKPAPPLNLRTLVNGDSIVLVWDCYVNDLSSYTIYRSLPGGGWEIADIEPKKSEAVTKTWTDPGRADDLVEYQYQVEHYDGSKYSDKTWIFYADWVVTSYLELVDRSILVNGSLIVEQNGYLDLKNTSVTINGSHYKPRPEKIEVRNGGTLSMADLDNDPLTSDDASHLNASTTLGCYEFKVLSGGRIEAYNSVIENASCDLPSGETNIAIYSDNCILINNTIDARDTGILLDGAEFITIKGNLFLRPNNAGQYQYGIVIASSNNITVQDNIIFNYTISGIEVSDSDHITIQGNDIETGYQGGAQPEGIDITDSNNVYILENDLDCTNIALNGMNINGLYIAQNTIVVTDDYPTSRTIMLNNIQTCVINDNVITGIIKNNWIIYGITIDNFRTLTLQNNNLSGLYIGLQLRYTYLQDKKEVLVSNNSIHNIYPLDGICIYLHQSSNMIFKNNKIYNALYGVYIQQSEILDFVGDDLWNVTWAYTIETNSNLTLMNTSISTDSPYPVTIQSASAAIIINAYFDLEKLRIMDQSSAAWIYWGATIRIKDHFGNYVPDIYLRVRNKQGTVIYERYTDPDGYIGYLVILEYYKAFDYETYYSPVTFEAKYSNHSFEFDHDMIEYVFFDLQLDNNAPNVYNIFITPLVARTIDNLNLILSYQYLDKEGDPENHTAYQWFRNGIHVPQLDNQTVVPSNWTTKGEAWYCQVIPSDNIDFGTPGLSITVIISNTEPVVSNVSLTPPDPDGKSDLQVSYDYEDIDNDVELGTLFYWYARTGGAFEWKVTTSSPVLPFTFTLEGEDWYVEVEPKDGEESGNRSKSNIVSIGNTVPTVENLRVYPGEPTTSDDLVVVYEFVDVDSDPEVNTRYKWFKWYPGLPENVTYVESGFLTRSVPSEFLTRGEIWWCVVTPHDGSVYGVPVNSTKVTIKNSPPVISNVKVTPSSPVSGDDISITYDYYDRDGDPESGTLLDWYKYEDTGFVKTGIQIQILPAVLTANDEVWLCEISPRDGFDFGQILKTPQITISNNPPLAEDVQIIPSHPKTMDDLTAYYEFFDADSEPENGTLIKWYKNDVHQEQYDGLPVLASSATVKGEYWYFTVQPGTDNALGKVYKSPKVLIENTPPLIMDSIIDPKEPISGNYLGASYTVYDPDNDAVEVSEIKWYRNGQEQQQYFNYDLIPPDATDKGQIWKYTIQVFDGEEYSILNESDFVTILNSPPMIKNIYPPESSINMTETESQRFSIDTEDADGDLIVVQWFRDTWIVGKDPTFMFDTDYESAGDYQIRVSVQDWGAGSVLVTHEWNVSVRNNNRAPIIHVNEPLNPHPRIKKGESLNFHITYEELDIGDETVVSWYVDGTKMLTGETIYAYTKDSIGTHEVKVTVSDYVTTTEYSWNVTVRESQAIQTEFIGLNWDQWSIVLEALVIGVTGLVAFAGFLRYRKRKGALQYYLREIEDLMRSWGDDPDHAESELLNLSEEIELDFAGGKIEDFHYFLLDRQLKESLREIRQNKIRSSFASLPEEIRRKVNNVLEDGRVTDKEYRKFISTISESQDVSEEDRIRLRELVRGWKDVDATEKAKKVKIKEIAVKRKKMSRKFDASALGWEEFGSAGVARGVRRKAMDLGWQDVFRPGMEPSKRQRRGMHAQVEDVPLERHKRTKLKPGLLGWQDIERPDGELTPKKDDADDLFDTEELI